MNANLKATIIVLIILIFMQLQACDVEGPRLMTHIINLSKDTVYVDHIGGSCDSCELIRDVRQFCDHDSGVFYEKLSPNDSTILTVKYDEEVKLLVINVDSLKNYRSKGYTYNITSKKWVKVLVNDKIKGDTKSCTFTIN
jgi:hypothetical protein